MFLSSLWMCVAVFEPDGALGQLPFAAAKIAEHPDLAWVANNRSKPTGGDGGGVQTFPVVSTGAVWKSGL